MDSGSIGNGLNITILVYQKKMQTMQKNPKFVVYYSEANMSETKPSMKPYPDNPDIKMMLPVIGHTECLTSPFGLIITSPDPQGINIATICFRSRKDLCLSIYLTG